MNDVMKQIISVLFVTFLCCSCSKDGDPIVFQGQACLKGTWLGAGCPGLIGPDTLIVTDNQVFINSADCESICVNDFLRRTTIYGIADISEEDIVVIPAGRINCGIPEPMIGENTRIAYNCEEDMLIWNNQSFQRLLEAIPCFEGIWELERCEDERSGKDILDINPLGQLIITAADCNNNCPLNHIGEPSFIQIEDVISYSEERIFLRTRSLIRCGEAKEVTQDTFPVGYECKGDTLFWGDLPFKLLRKYR